MEDLNYQLKAARDERETGDATKALEMFLKIDRLKLDSKQLFDYLSELGLTYWHLKNFAKSKATFEEAQKYATEINSKSYQAVTLRQLSRPEFNDGKPNSAVELAKQARQLAFEEQRGDLAWFDHGVITTLLFTNAPAEEIKKWFEIESKDLYTVSRNTKDEIAKWVWTCGLLIDRSQVFNTVSDLYLALMIADHFNLARRKEQIEELIRKTHK